MGGGARHVLQGGQALPHKLGHLFQRAARDNDGEIKGAAHQIDALHLVVLVDALGHPVKAVAPLGRHLHLNEGGDRLPVGAVPVHDGLIAQDGLVRLIALNGGLHVRHSHIRHGCKLFMGQRAVLFQKPEQLCHNTSSHLHLSPRKPRDSFINSYYIRPLPGLQ